jgi:ferredoxin, 2Fe-2S
MFKVSVPQKNIILEANNNKNLMDLLIENNLPVASSCLGEGLCSKCVVQITPAGIQSELELKTLAKNKRDLTDRLCCQVFVTCDMVVTTGYW